MRFAALSLLVLLGIGWLVVLLAPDTLVSVAAGRIGAHRVVVERLPIAFFALVRRANTCQLMPLSPGWGEAGALWIR